MSADKITPDGLRAMGAMAYELGQHTMYRHYHAHADALEDNTALRAEVERLREDADAATRYGKTAQAHGFSNAPAWSELAEETKQLYREAATDSARAAK